MPSSPRTPTRRRKSSNVNRSFSDLHKFDCSPKEHRWNRKLSLNSVQSPTSIESASLNCDSLCVGASDRLSGGLDEPNGLGNLADELAEAWDDESGHSRQVGNPAMHDGADGSPNSYIEPRGRLTFDIHQDIDSSLLSSSYEGAIDVRSLSPPRRFTQSGLGRRPSKVSDYDGSDYGDNSDLEDVEGISASLEHHLAAIEGLARRGTESNGSGADMVFTRVVDSLRDLGSQVNVETGATRLLTAHTAVASNLSSQTRLIQTLSHHLVSPFAIPPAPDDIDALLDLLVATLDLLPAPNTRTISALHSLHSSTLELIATLSMLADSIYMLRQTTSLASRKLKAAKDVVDELRREARLTDEGIRWIEKGNWDTRLSNRECGAICGDVVDGFRNVCESWEETIRKDALGHHVLEVAAG
ncbi:MAG: hypothetical protein Q9170_000541 [Blastenia crenularia]